MGSEDRIRAMVGQRPAVPEYIQSPEPALVLPGAAHALGNREYRSAVQSLLNPFGLEAKSDANTRTPAFSADDAVEDNRAWRERVGPARMPLGPGRGAVEEPMPPKIPIHEVPPPPGSWNGFAAGGFTSPTKILTSKRSGQMAGSPGLLSGLMG